VDGDHQNALESGQRALAMGKATGDFALQIAANQYLGPTYHALGDYRHAIDVLRRNRESLTGDYLHQRLGLSFLPSVLSRAWLLYCLAEVGAFSEGTEIGEEARRVAEEADDAFSLGAAYYGIGLLALRRGEFPAAISWLEQSLALCRQRHVPLSFPWVAAAHTLAGTPDCRAG